YDFNETVWGKMTRHYLEPIEALLDEQFELVVKETQKYGKGKGKGVATTSLENSANDDGEFNNLFFLSLTISCTVLSLACLLTVKIGFLQAVPELSEEQSRLWLQLMCCTLV
ncbi:hypothetical protein PAXRUDRAFT_135919, partial [Paxillus rubicundulus Ve08.2h10]